MSAEYRMNHSDSELSEGKNEKLAQLHLFFHPEDPGELQSTEVCSLISVVSMQQAGDHK